MYKCVVIDDDELSRGAMRHLISHYQDLELVAEFSDGQKALAFLQETKIDLLFVDVLMPGISGLELIQKIAADTGVIIISDYKEFAVDAFTLQVIDYLHKPVKIDRFAVAVRKFYQKMSSGKQEQVKGRHLFLKVDGIYRKISFDEIVYIENDGNYINIVTQSDTITPYGTIKEIESRLPAKLFFKPHRSYLVSINFVEGVDENFIITPKKLIPISRDKRKEIYELLGLKS
ncbi:response regulator [bacterium]|nr:response regulator [bacterium]